MSAIPKVPKWIGQEDAMHEVAKLADDKQGEKPWYIMIRLPKRIKTAKAADKMLGGLMGWILDHYNKDYNDH